jgi:hypothetical protein
MTISSQDLEAYRGAGVSDDPRDTVQNTIKLLQTNAKETNRRDPKYVNGAEPGDYFLFGVPEPIIKGEEGFLFTPIGPQPSYMEWLPDGAGLAARHPIEPPDAKWVDDETGKRLLRRDGGRGNRVEETVFLSGLFNGELWALPFRSSSLRIFGRFNSQLKNLGLPAFGTKWSVTSELVAFGGNSWFQPRFKLVGKVNEPDGPSDEEFEAAKQFYEGYGFAQLIRSTRAASAVTAPAKKVITLTARRRQHEDLPAGTRDFAPIDDDIPF